MIKIKNLTKKYKELVVLDGASFDFSNNGLTCLLGASGCGKSTLLNIIAGFDSCYDGDVSVCGVSISKMNPDELCAYRRDNIGFVFQNYHLLSGYSVLENILLACEHNDIDTSDNVKKIKELLDKLGILEKLNERIVNLSGGQKQRVAIARALINNPQIILADEPTGALDRNNSNEIMALLKEISKDRLVIVITHDQKICDFADEIIHIKDGKIESENDVDKECAKIEKSLCINNFSEISAFKRGYKNFKVHLKRYIAVGLAISVGVLAFMLSLSSGNIIGKSISDFKEKNTAFNNGYIKISDDEQVLEILKSDTRIENAYYQYEINDVGLSFGDKTEKMVEKFPMPKVTEVMSYGSMPEKGENQIALSPSLAKKFDNNINQLIGKQINLKYDGREFSLTISGIFNAGYDDFFVSCDVEQDLYKNISDEKIYSVSYDVKDFEDVVPVSQMLADKGIESKNASKEVATLENTFKNLNSLFFIISVLILIIGLFISVILLVKLQNSRFREIGLFSALGFSKKSIRKIVISENLLLSALAGVFNGVLIICSYLIVAVFDIMIIINPLQILISIVATGVVVIIISLIASHKLINTEPAVALK